MTQVISVVQEKGGAGKTTLLTAIASLMVQDGARVAVIDTDPQRHLEAWAKKEQTDLDWLYEEDDEKLIPTVKALKKADPAYDAAMRAALETLPEGRSVDYINAHGTSTPVGDVGEIEAVRRVFGQGTTPPVSSTKSMTGHAQGAAGALEAIFSLLMLEHDFITPSINVETLDPDLDPSEIATELRTGAGLDSVMTNSFGFGGTNGSMILSKFHG